VNGLDDFPPEISKPDPRGHVRVTLRMQWDTTITSFETFIPHEFVHEVPSAELFEHYCRELWGHTLAELKDRSVERMMQGNHLA
jgi:hypothetical protein